MFSKPIRTLILSAIGKQFLSTSPNTNRKVCVLGASGGIGQPLALLLKISPLVSQLSLYDLADTIGVAKDLSHIETPCKTSGFTTPRELKDCLRGAEVVMIPAGLPRKPGMDRDDLFKTNAGVVLQLTEAIAEVCPKALIGIITNPVNSTVPIAAEILKKAGVFDPRKLFGVTTLDVVRANTFIGDLKGLSPQQVNCPVIGGHSGVTIIPLFSQCKPTLNFEEHELKSLAVKIQDAGTEVVKAKAGNGSATLSMAYAAARFANSLLRGLKGESGVIECAYVHSNITEASFLATQIELGRDGLEKNFGLGKLSSFEEAMLAKAMPELKKNIQQGLKFASLNQ